MGFWLPVRDFPGYSVSTEGRIRNDVTNRDLSLSQGNRGVVVVNLHRESRWHTRAVSILVAQAHCAPPEYYTYNSPIHLDGQRSNLNAYNLAWRPRWFAIKHNRQFHTPRLLVTKPIILLNTGEVQDQAFPFVLKYGLLEREILMSLGCDDVVFPGRLDFRFAHKVTINK